MHALTRRRGRFALVLAVLLVLGGCRAASRPPNVVLVLSDDQGWDNLSAHGNHNLATPRIDSLAADGAALEHFYVSPVCSPTRADLLTGRYHPRGGVYGTSARAERLDLDERIVAQAFRDAGYVTGAFGKWHNGSQSPYHPNARGFDEFYGFTSGHWARYFDPPLDHNGRRVQGQGQSAGDCHLWENPRIQEAGMIPRPGHVAIALLFLFAAPLQARQTPATNTIETGVIAGAPYYIELPATWNKGLVLHAHGYTPEGSEPPHHDFAGIQSHSRDLPVARVRVRSIQL